MKQSKQTDIYCCKCEKVVAARLTDGREIYPHLSRLADHPYWKCDACGCYVGCHHRHKNKAKRTSPLGVIPTPEIRKVRSDIHAVIDPLWRRKHPRISRRAIYSILAQKLGKEIYHTGGIRTLAEAEEVFRVALEIKQKYGGSTWGSS